MRLKSSFFTFVLGILLSANAVAQCATYQGVMGEGSQTFFDTVSSSSGGLDVDCIIVNLPGNSILQLDWIDDATGANRVYLDITSASFNYYDDGFEATGWRFENLPSDVYTVNWAFEGSIGSVFTSVVGVYPVMAPVPEPSTYALMLAGLGAIAFLAHRRRLKATWVPVPISTTPR